MTGVVSGDNWSCKTCSQIVTTNKPTLNFLQAGCPSCRKTISVKALKGKSITFHGLAYPKLTCGYSNLVSEFSKDVPIFTISAKFRQAPAMCV